MSESGPQLARQDIANVVRELASLAEDQRTAISPSSLEGTLGRSWIGAMAACGADSTGVPDADANGVPEDLTLHWSASRCRVPASTLEGSVRIMDVGGRAGWAARVAYDSLTHTAEAGAFRRRETLSGTADVRLVARETVEVIVAATAHLRYTDARLSAVERRTFAYTTHVRVGQGFPASFTPASRREVVVSGTLARVVELPTQRDSVLFSVTTPAPLVADATPCGGAFRSGRLRAVTTGALRGVAEYRVTC
jgi:hypothetical protein